MTDDRLFRRPLPWRLALAEVVASGLAAATATGRPPVLALSGGRTPRGYLPTLVRAAVPWSNTVITLADDRAVPACNAASNLGLVRRAFQPLRPALRPTVVPLTMRDVPLPDVAVLGMGTDGHTASLFPDLPRRPGRSPLTETLRRPADAYDRLTLSLDALAAVPMLVFMLSADKLPLWHRIRAGDPAVAGLPTAQLLHLRDGRATALLLEE